MAKPRARDAKAVFIEKQKINLIFKHKCIFSKINNKKFINNIIYIINNQR